MLKYLFLLSAAIVAAPLSAQVAEEAFEEEAARDMPVTPFEPDSNAAPITVTATGLATNVVNTGQSVTVIGQPEIESIQGADIARVLTRAPSVSITRNGPLGSFTGV